MEKSLDYDQLYRLQERIMECIFSLQNGFYLTGGTALHRFYYNARYSDDLDFFVSSSNTFYEDIYMIFELCTQKGLELKKIVQTRDFHRYIVDGNLQVDFVNDRVYRYGKSKLIDGFRIDNTINILTNKIGALIDRDEEKDIFDLVCITSNEDFVWQDVLEIADKKANIEKDILLYRLKTFPLEWLKRIKSIKEITITKEIIMQICEDIALEKKNSLKGKL